MKSHDHTNTVFQYCHQGVTEAEKSRVFTVGNLPMVFHHILVRLRATTVQAPMFLYLAFPINVILQSIQITSDIITLIYFVQILSSVMYAECVFKVTILGRKSIHFHKYKKLEHCIPDIL